MGVLSDAQAYAAKAGLSQASLVSAARAGVRSTVRVIVERYEHASLDAKADREALIKALVEALT